MVTPAERKQLQWRLEKRFDNSIAELYASNPKKFSKIRNDARKQAMQQLGIDKMYPKLEKLKKQQADLVKQIEQTKLQLLCQALHIKPASAHYYEYQEDYRIETVIQTEADAQEKVLMNAFPTGAKIVQFQYEKEQLPIAILTATTTKGVSLLSEAVTKLLKDDQSILQLAAERIAIGHGRR